MNIGVSRDIPDSIKREVRQRCGFGCVICGHPIIQYDHMKEWAVYKRHVAEEITLLCSTHHQEKTSGLLSHITVEKNNKNPHNKRVPFSPKWKIHYESSVVLEMGAMEVTAQETSGVGDRQFFSIPLMIGGLPIIWFNLEGGNLLLNISLYAKERPLLLIINNELIYSTEIWDIEFVGKTLTIREGSRKIVVCITFNVEQNRVVIDKGRIVQNEREIIIKKDYFQIDTNRWYGGGMQCNGIGINC